MSTFYNFALKIETSRAKKVFKPIFKFEMSVILFWMSGLFILRLKKLKICNVKKKKKKKKPKKKKFTKKT